MRYFRLSVATDMHTAPPYSPPGFKASAQGHRLAGEHTREHEKDYISFPGASTRDEQGMKEAFLHAKTLDVDAREVIRAGVRPVCHAAADER